MLATARVIGNGGGVLRNWCVCVCGGGGGHRKLVWGGKGSLKIGGKVIKNWGEKDHSKLGGEGVGH